LVSGATIDIVLPVLNEEHCVAQSVRTLCRRLDAQFPHEWIVTIVDNGSSDQTWQIASGLSASDSRIRAVRLDRRGRGKALKQAWSTSTSDVVAYMDIDLSTDLDALTSLIDPIVSGDCDLVIGSRLARGARVDRSIQREAISRIYNVICRAALGYSVRDAQCGFKALRSDMARSLVPQVLDDDWFFDTELLSLAHRLGLRIREVPVRWVEDPDSRVRIVRTAIDDLKGIWRIWRTQGRPTRPTPEPPPLPSTSTQQLVERACESQPSFDFDAHAPTYKEAVDRSVSFTGRDSDFFAQRKVRILKELTSSQLEPLDELSVLDVGCGTGTTSRHLSGHVGSLRGVDVSREMLEIAREEIPDGDFDWYDGEKLPYTDSTFDVVLAICVLHHIQPSRRHEFVSELVRVTRHRGLIVLFEHNPVNPLTRRAVRSCELDRGVKLLTGKKAESLLTDAGAELTTRTNFLFSPFGGELGIKIDRRLARVPVGGQYAAVGRALKLDSRRSSLSGSPSALSEEAPSSIAEW
jgi:SAM-dependent methyltransferase